MKNAVFGQVHQPLISNQFSIFIAWDSVSANLLLARPNDALILFRHGPDSLVDELLDTLAAIGFSGVDVSFRIHGDAVNAVEFAWLPAAFAEGGQDLE